MNRSTSPGRAAALLTFFTVLGGCGVEGVTEDPFDVEPVAVDPRQADPRQTALDLPGGVALPFDPSAPRKLERRPSNFDFSRPFNGRKTPMPINEDFIVTMNAFPLPSQTAIVVPPETPRRELPLDPRIGAVEVVEARPPTVVVCSEETRMCGGVCVNLVDDELNCGACGVVCGDAESCHLGLCTAGCEEA